MTLPPAARRRSPMGAAALTLLSLSACAGTQTAAPVTPAAAPVAAPMVTMAPIANPEHAAPTRREPQATHPRSPEGVAPHRAAPAHPAPAASPPAAAPTSAVDPAAAARLRARGLEELNRGAVAKAVALLTQASRLDPGSAVIRRDLERAERINRAVHAPH